MSTTYNIGLLKMQFDENNRLVPFSEEIIHLNSYDDIMNYLKENDLQEGILLMNSVANKQDLDLVGYSYSKIEYGNNSDFLNCEVKERSKQKKLERKHD